MRIKKVQIWAFASYQKLEMTEDLSPGCNLILGKNGSGKSNFLQGNFTIP
jgi:structural maintenance of chromosome 3 (chondroitin sulfate proteoglycan 6)